ncbi:hypothetical protein [Roseisolibacter sp. H3M3-2]|uniref:response regulator n=1 Tax=Roseisolibacter sp. H3M3-2 TaxID=3031323 RepID=UPI0023DCC563|nr:hypothetical protein [Roseisolibacter sp. H3M3-2]MDF1502856.1 hypothetical protein [Roseisolibacter sp. H3M3-2]
MLDSSADGRPPAVLLVSHHDWLVLALGAAARGWGFTTSRAASLAQAIHVADALDPDVVFVDVWMDRDGRAESVAASLRAAGAIGPVTPVLALSGAPLSRGERMDALIDGAWDVVELPIDTVALRLRLATWIAAKRHADQLRNAGVHDRLAPVYNLRGLLGRARELGAEAARAGAPLCCVGIELGPLAADADPATGLRGVELAGERVRSAWEATGRASDVVGRVGRDQYAVLAPRTGEDGGRILADRLARSLAADGRLRPRTSVLALEPTRAGAADGAALIGRTMARLGPPASEPAFAAR